MDLTFQFVTIVDADRLAEYDSKNKRSLIIGKCNIQTNPLIKGQEVRWSIEEDSKLKENFPNFFLQSKVAFCLYLVFNKQLYTFFGKTLGK